MKIYNVVLKDGTQFVVKRSFWDKLNDGLFDRRFTVIKEDPTHNLSAGSRIIVPNHSISYMVKLNKRG